MRYLARTIPFDLDLLRERYEQELRPYLGNPKREDLTLKLWTEAIEEDRSQEPQYPSGAVVRSYSTNRVRDWMLVSHAIG
ncbi:hypothetical protein [Occallatibacter riparius]|uniref:Uncharacterized protein n=1 Tax=Occallatibacter riparius TaxID=1002689 RepID=A0A9J7BT52_9BACT|nr:hypothetical protein [Occallatibacter riparius]UWZ85824.1 hypothetical protein MOP44_07720 [Occallatibacter riparius]